jgi:hypothetical protein
MFRVADHWLGPRLPVHGFAPMGRLGAPSMYCRTADRLEISRVLLVEHQEAIAARFDAPHLRCKICLTSSSWKSTS